MMQNGTRGPVRIAVLSLAHPHAFSYLNAFASRPGVSVVLADPDGEHAAGTGPRGRQAAIELGVEYCSSYAEALGEEHGQAADAVVICSENARHLELARLAASPGRYILCEKPLGASFDQAAELVDIVERAGARLMTAYPVRFSPVFTQLRARIAAGEIGSVMAVTASNNGYCPVDQRPWFTDPELAGGGVLLDHVVHCADLLDDLLGPAVGPVFAASNTLLHSREDVRVETGGLVTLRYAGGITASIDCSWSQPATSPTWGGVTFDVIGTDGEIRIEPFAGHVGGHDRHGAVWLDIGPDLDRLMIDELLSALREQRQPHPSGRTGLRTMAVVDAALRSARSGAAEPLPRIQAREHRTD